MDSSTVTDRLLQLVTFKLDNEEYAVDILKVQEINRLKEFTRVPNSPPYVEGVINLRGKVIPVVNLRKRFGFAGKEYDEWSRIMIMDIHGIRLGLVVDSVSEVLRIPSSTVDPSPTITSDIGAEFIKGIAKLENRLIILLDMDSLIGKPEGTAMVAATTKALN